MKRIIGIAAALFAGAALAQGQGVSKNEIVIGSMQDLSGPIVAFSKQLKYGMEMRVAEVNAEPPEASSAVTRMYETPMSVVAGLPVKVPAAGSKLNHAGSSPPSNILADSASSSPASAS